MLRLSVSLWLLVTLIIPCLSWNIPTNSENHSNSQPLSTSTPQSKNIPQKPLSSWDSYTLKNWTEEAAEQAVLEINTERLKSNEFWDEWEAGHTYDKQDYEYAYNVINREMLIRFPDFHDPTKLYLQIANIDTNLVYWPYFQSAFHVIDPIRTLLEDFLNQGRTSPDGNGITKWFKENNLPITIEESIYVNHLFDNGKPGQVFRLDKDGFWSILLILEGERPGEYRLHTLYDDWSMTFQDRWTIRIDDFNANGQSEIVIHHIGYGVGSTHQCYQRTESFEWDGMQFHDLIKGVDFFWVSTDFGDCGGWDYVSGSDGTKILTAKKLIGIGCYEISDLVYLTHYQWNGNIYVLSGEEIEPFNIPDRPNCAIHWAYEAGPYNEQAVSILETYLQHWPISEKINNSWGPAAEDYFRYKLGLWYAFRGESGKAVDTLKRVRDHPTVSEFAMSSTIASTFLSQYQGKGVFAGCKAVNNLLSRSINDFRNPSQGWVYSDFDIKKMQSSWGFGDFGWAVNDRIFSLSNTTGRSQEAVVCSLTEAFRSSIRYAKIVSKSDLIQWLYHNEVPIIF